MAAPFVAGAMANFVSWEVINNNAARVYSRLAANQISNALTGFPARPATVNKLCDIGINNPNKDPLVPYKGAPGRDLAYAGDPSTAASGAASATLVTGCKLLKYCSAKIIINTY
jgi:hypothetical protein